VHAVKEKRSDLGYYTVCRRAYEKSPLDVPDRVVTCVWCITGKLWPSGVTIHNPCAEIPLGIAGTATMHDLGKKSR
jgi:hypothetical protein